MIKFINIYLNFNKSKHIRNKRQESTENILNLLEISFSRIENRIQKKWIYT